MSNPRLTGMVCNGKPSNMSKGSNLISQRKAVTKRKSKKKLSCKGGPLDGEFLYLSVGGTLPFSMNGFKGFYNRDMKWVDKVISI